MQSVRGSLARRVSLIVATAALAVGGAVLVPAVANASGNNAYIQRNLISDQASRARTPDKHVVNAWGLAASSTSPLWVSDNETGLATVYTGATPDTPVTKVPLVVTIPGGAPTGQVFNDTADFNLTGNMNPAIFLFDSEAGKISGWNPNAMATTAVTKVNKPGAVFKGLALASTPSGSRLYAADFSHATVDVYDGSFMPVMHPGAFTDPQLPNGFAPFNVQTIGDHVYVAYAKQDPAKEDEVAGRGLGRVDVYTLDGQLVMRLHDHSALNAPWGLVIAPHDFGVFSDMLLVGNFGDGLIHAYDPMTGMLMGTLINRQNSQVRIDGLWALRLGNGTFGNANQVIFSAGPVDESHGLVGTLTAG